MKAGIFDSDLPNCSSLPDLLLQNSPHAQISPFSFSYFLGIPNLSTLPSESACSYSLESSCFLHPNELSHDKRRQAFLFYQIITSPHFCPIIEVCGTPGNTVFPALPLHLVNTVCLPIYSLECRFGHSHTAMPRIT